MKVTIQITHYESDYIDFSIVHTRKCEEPKHFHGWEEPKWVNFCKKHHFNPKKDYRSKIYHLYLQLCAEGMV